MSESPENETPTLLDEIRAGTQRQFDAADLCFLMTQLLAEPDYWDDDGYLIHMQFHRDEVRTITNFMSIGIGAHNSAQQDPANGIPEAMIPLALAPRAVFLEQAETFDSAALGVFIGPDDECDTAPQSPPDNQASTKA